MNRLVIIGNGFDLAHGLPTSYKDFIDDYWRGIKDSSHNDEFVSFQSMGQHFKFDPVKNLEGLANNIMQNDENIKFSDAEIYRETGNNRSGKYPRAHILNYKNAFFSLINQKSIQNWVDIENEYYTELKKIVKSTMISIESKKQNLIILNKEFEEVKKRLEKYLLEKVFNKYSFEFNDENKLKTIISERFDYSDFKNEDLKLIDDVTDGKVKRNLLFLNFNYTNSINFYCNDFKAKEEYYLVNNIHGDLEDGENLINFGFGDEMDDDYKIIENINDNEYLRNFKSFQYLQNSNYKSLLDFVESDQKFQVYIMGHSCGLSDRTLLNTIFEHNNCRSIKVFFHETKDEKGIVIKDNYTEIIQNISRHFNKKKLMREKIVNKTLCQPLPQIQLSLK